MQEQPNNNQQPEEKWFFESEEEQSMGIETCTYDNGQRMKRAKLSDGRIAVCRRLKGNDVKFIQRMIGGDQEKYQTASMARATEIDGKKVTPEDLEDLWMDDYSTIMVMSSINFSTTPKA